MKKLKYILFFLILVLSPKVFCATYNVSSKIEAIPSFGGGTYTGYTPATAVVPNYYNVNTRYNGKLSIVEFYLNSDDWDWNYNKTYTITLNMATEDWRNNFMGPQVFSAQSNGSTTGSNLYVSNTFRFISYKQVKFNFKIGSTLGPYIKFRLYSSNTTITAITGISNFNLSSVNISSVSSTPSPTPAVTPKPTPTPQPNNQDIINNQTENTNSIINNNNQNTEDIINNNNSNTTDVINNNNQNTDVINKSLNSSCKEGPFVLNISDYGYLRASSLKTDGTTQSDSIWWNVSPYFALKPNTDYTIKTEGGGLLTSAHYCFYSQNKEEHSCYNFTNVSEFTFNSALWGYVRFDITSSRRYTLFGPICNNWEQEAQNDTTNAIKQQNEYLMDNSNPNISDNDFLNTFNSIGINDPLSYLLTLPTQLINKLIDLSDTCTSIDLGTLYGVMISLPCIYLEDILGSTVWNIIDIIFTVSLLAVILKNLYDTFSNLLTMGAEKEAKEKFSMPTPMDFLSMILGGDR